MARNGSRGRVPRGPGAPRSVYSGATVLAVGAHPDDLEIGLGGTIARLCAAGTRVVMAVVAVPARLRERLDGAARAAAVLGAELRVLVPDRETQVEDLRACELSELIGGLARALNPAAVFSHGAAEFHRDHLLVYEACLEASQAVSADHLCYCPPACGPLPLHFMPHAFMDVTDYMDRKLRAIRANGRLSSPGSFAMPVVLERAREHGRLIGVRYAEGFEVIQTRLV